MVIRSREIQETFYKIIHRRSCGTACRVMTLFCISEVLYSLGFRKLSLTVGFHVLCREGYQNLNKRTTAIIKNTVSSQPT